jgi:uncharacterized protein
MSSFFARRTMLKLSAIAGASFLVGQAANDEPPAAIAASPDSPNVAIVKRYYDAYGSGDLATVRSILAPDIAWKIPGHHPLAGTKHGVDEVFAFFQQLARANFRAEVLFLGGNDSYVVDVHRGWSNTGQDDIDELWTLMFRIQDERIVEAVNFPGNQHAADAFFWKHYSLKPLPDRLAETL